MTRMRAETAAPQMVTITVGMPIAGSMGTVRFSLVLYVSGLDNFDEEPVANAEYVSGHDDGLTGLVRQESRGASQRSGGACDQFGCLGSGDGPSRLVHGR